MTDLLVHNTSALLTEQDREPLTGPLAQYESQSFCTTVAINPLVAAAMPLLSLNVRLTPNSQSAVLIQNCIHEMKAFESTAHQQGYRAATILAARYLLCCLIDESLQDNQLLSYFQKEQWGGDRFFTIIERASEDPAALIDFLELGYICLSQGYQGKYRQQNDTQSLGIFIDHLFQLIQQQRGEKRQPLLTSPTKPSFKQSIWAALPPWWLTFGITLGLLTIIFFPYYHRLSETAKPIEHDLKTLVQ